MKVVISYDKDMIIRLTYLKHISDVLSVVIMTVNYVI